MGIVLDEEEYGWWCSGALQWAGDAGGVCREMGRVKKNYTYTGSLWLIQDFFHVHLGHLLPLLPMALLFPYSLLHLRFASHPFITCTHVQCLLSLLHFPAYSTYGSISLYKSFTPTGLPLLSFVLSVSLRSFKLYVPWYQPALWHMLEDWNLPCNNMHWETADGLYEDGTLLPWRWKQQIFL